MVFRPALIPYRFLVCAVKVDQLWGILSDHLNKARSCEAWSSDEPRWFAWHQISRITMPPGDAVDGSTRQTHATSNSILPSRASASASCLMQIGVGWRAIRTISETWERNMQLLIRTSHNAKADLENDHLSCGFGLRRSHLSLKWKSGQDKVGFRWGAVTGTFHINFSPLEAQKCDTYRFYWLKWDCNKLFFQKWSTQDQMCLQMIALSRFVICNSFIFYVDLEFLVDTLLRSVESIYIMIRPF